MWGTRYIRDKFGKEQRVFWLPDTFGYSAALPQIMQGFGVTGFLTTKLAWNDTNRFPYETFVWKGIDGSSVVAHFFVIDTWPDRPGCWNALRALATRTTLPASRRSRSGWWPLAMAMAAVDRSLR